MIDCEERVVSAQQFAQILGRNALDEKRYFGGLGGASPRAGEVSAMTTGRRLTAPRKRGRRPSFRGTQLFKTRHNLLKMKRGRNIFVFQNLSALAVGNPKIFSPST